MASRTSRAQRADLIQLRLLLVALLLGFASSASCLLAEDSAWVRPTKAGDPLIWGRRDGLVFGLASPGGIKGPRGLIRIGVYVPGSAAPELINFIAVEPVVAGPGRRFDRMAFSELEQSQMDAGQQGKRMWVESDDPSGAPPRGTLTTFHTGQATVERLSVPVEVERFSRNGAHVAVDLSMDSDHPGELRLTPHARPDSPQIEELTVTATMGNFERLRLLWLDGRTEDSRELFSNFVGDGFAETPDLPLPELLRTGDGAAVVFCTTDEASPTDVPAHWVYPLPKYTQYWEVEGADIQPDLRVHVNGRRVYWASTDPLPGGVAFENFEVRQHYVDGQTFLFGLTQAEPSQAYQGAQKLQVRPDRLKAPPTLPEVRRP